MTVNGGTTNNPIFFSELQTAFGGTNPIFLNEYYRGGQVSTNRTVTSYAAMSNSGSGSGTARGIQVAQTSTPGGTIAAGNNDLSTTLLVNDLLDKPQLVEYQVALSWEVLMVAQCVPMRGTSGSLLCVILLTGRLQEPR